MPAKTLTKNRKNRTAPARLRVAKTYKLFIGGAFPRTESGRYLQALAADGKSVLANYCHASKKDFRDAVVKARGAFGKWAPSSAYLRGQILYRAAEILENRSAELVEEVRRSSGATEAAARTEVHAAVDLFVHYAGWTDKFTQISGAVNPVATSHFNFTIPEPTGVVAVFCPEESPLLPFVGLVVPVILSGNCAVVMASEKHPLTAITLAEILATSDLPGGVVNILTGPQKEIAPHAAGHMDVNAVVDGNGSPALGKELQSGTATNMKRYTARALTPQQWREKAENPYWILDTVEFKTAWHPIGV